MVSGDDVDPTPADAPDADADDSADDGVDEVADDELWPDDEQAPRQGISPKALVIGAVAVLALIIILIATGGSSDDSKDERAKISSTTTTAEQGPSWPAVVQGRPAVFGSTGDPISAVAADAEPGVYVWTDYDGWHAWVVDPSGKAASKGSISSNVAFKSASVAETDRGTAEVQDTKLPFDFSDVDVKAAGVNFDLGFYADEVTVNLDGTDLPLFLGTEAKESALPAVISKAVQPN